MDVFEVDASVIKRLMSCTYETIKMLIVWSSHHSYPVRKHHFNPEGQSLLPEHRPEAEPCVGSLLTSRQCPTHSVLPTYVTGRSSSHCLHPGGRILDSSVAFLCHFVLCNLN